MSDPMTTIDTSPEALERLAEKARSGTYDIHSLADLLDTIAAEKRAGPGDTTAFLAGALAMQKAAETMLREIGDGYMRGRDEAAKCASDRVGLPIEEYWLKVASQREGIGASIYEYAAAIRAIDPAALTERPVAPVVADGWNYDMSAAPDDAFIAGHLYNNPENGYWMALARRVNGVWYALGADDIPEDANPVYPPTAWRHLPAPPAKQEQTK